MNEDRLLSFISDHKKKNNDPENRKVENLLCKNQKWILGIYRAK